MLKFGRTFTSKPLKPLHRRNLCGLLTARDRPTSHSNQSNLSQSRNVSKLTPRDLIPSKGAQEDALDVIEEEYVHAEHAVRVDYLMLHGYTL